MKEIKLVPGRRYKMANGLKAVIDGKNGDGTYSGRAEIVCGIFSLYTWLDRGENLTNAIFDIVAEWSE